MRKSKTIFLLSLLKNKERKYFKKFLMSSYFNADEKVVQLFDILIKYYPGFESEMLQKEEVCKRLFQKQYSDKMSGKLRKIAFRLSELTEKFFTINQIFISEIEKRKINNIEEKCDLGCDSIIIKEVERHKILAASLAERGDLKYFGKEIQEAKKYLEKTINRGLRYYRLAAEINELNYSHPDAMRHSAKTSANSDAKKLIYSKHQVLGKVEHDLDRYFVLSKLYYSSEMYSRQHIYSEKYDFWMIDEVINYPWGNQAEDDNEFSYFLLYKKFVLLNKDFKEHKYFFDIKKYIDRHSDVIDIAAKKIIFQYLINYTGRAIYNGYDDFIELRYELYKTGLEKGFFLHNKRMMLSTFLNIVTSSLEAEKMIRKKGKLPDNNELIDAQDFIKKHLKFIKTKSRKFAMTMGEAWVNYYRGEYAKVNKDLDGSIWPTPRLKIIVRSLQIRCQFNMQRIGEEVIFIQINSFRYHIMNNKYLSESRRKEYLNYINMIERLAKTKKQELISKQDIVKLRDALAGYKNIVAKGWLNDMIDDLETSGSVDL